MIAGYFKNHFLGYHNVFRAFFITFLVTNLLPLVLPPVGMAYFFYVMTLPELSMTSSEEFRALGIESGGLLKAVFEGYFHEMEAIADGWLFDPEATDPDCPVEFDGHSNKLEFLRQCYFSNPVSYYFYRGVVLLLNAIFFGFLLALPFLLFWAAFGVIASALRSLLEPSLTSWSVKKIVTVPLGLFLAFWAGAHFISFPVIAILAPVTMFLNGGSNEGWLSDTLAQYQEWYGGRLNELTEEAGKILTSLFEQTEAE